MVQLKWEVAFVSHDVVQRFNSCMVQLKSLQQGAGALRAVAF